MELLGLGAWLVHSQEAGGSPQGSGATCSAWFKPSGCDFFPGQQLLGTSFKNTLGRDPGSHCAPALPSLSSPHLFAAISNPCHPFLLMRLLLLVPQTCDLFPQALTVTLFSHLAGILFPFFVVLPQDFSYETAWCVCGGGGCQDTSQSPLRLPASLSLEGIQDA